jgi:hypothetical protein
MPHRPCVIVPACGSTRQDIRSRRLSPSWCPLSGDGGLVAKVRSLPSARGPGTSVEVAAAPGAWRGCGETRRGQRRADRFWRISISHTATKATMPICCLSAFRRFRQGCRRRVRGATPGSRAGQLPNELPFGPGTVPLRSALVSSVRSLPCVPSRSPGPSSIVFSPEGRGSPPAMPAKPCPP